MKKTILALVALGVLAFGADYSVMSEEAGQTFTQASTTNIGIGSMDTNVGVGDCTGPVGTGTGGSGKGKGKGGRK